MGGRILVAFLVIVCIMFCGCSKKKKTEELAAQSEIESVKTEEESDDIFDEFYDEEEKKEEPEPKKESFPTPSSQPQFSPEGRYVVQVSCVLSRDLAHDVVAQLENKGYPAYIAEVQNPTPDLIGTYQRIRIGGFNGVSLAREFGDNYLSPEGYDYWVDNRSNDNVGMGGYGLGESSTGGYETSAPSQPAPAATPPPNEEWGTSEPAAATQSDWQEPVATPAAEETPAPEKPVEKATPPPAEKTTPPPAEKAPKKAEEKAKTEKDEWGDMDDEWGADTSGW